MNEWLAVLSNWLSQGSDCVLITVASVVGSTPREVGASMLVKAESSKADDSGQSIDNSHGTIGGGHLEWQSLQIAQAMLNASDNLPIRLERFNLGARLGQCCGGRVLLLFEKISHTKANFWQALLNQWQTDQVLYRHLTANDSQSQWQVSMPIQTEFQSTGFYGVNTRLDLRVAGQSDWQFSQVITNTRFHVYLFGAGHIAQSLVKLLLPLSVQVHWIETRDYQSKLGMIDLNHPKLCYHETDIPESYIQTALPNSYFIVMTHDHSLDFQLCQTLLQRQSTHQDVHYFGMIGSNTKRQNFERRLLARGFSADDFALLTCPMGVAGIHSKEPIVIAVAIVAQLLQQ